MKSRISAWFAIWMALLTVAFYLWPEEHMVWWGAIGPSSVAGVVAGDRGAQAEPPLAVTPARRRAGLLRRRRRGGAPDGLFARPAAYTWQATSATMHTLPGGAFVIAEADGAEHGPDGAVEQFAYRITGLLSRRNSGAWLWRAVQGSEPT
ncbi:hypothetical protein [Dactylosporangium sp. NPDC049140]|uniref:hypothetical protein n=1 Tax=Dactylosporangium sp. NPDC049140 TaxID=3155647 RepID=UPI0033D805BD